MAIPFRLPTQQETDDNYQILDQLIDQLYHIVRQIILRRGRLVEEAPVPPASTNRAPAQRRGAAAEPAAPSVNMQLNQDLDLSLPLPDIVLSTGFVPESGPSGSRAPVPPPRRFAPATERPQPPPRRPRRRRPVDKRKREDTPEDTRPDQRQRENWLQVGKELRKIADGFRASNSSLQEDGGNRSSTDIEAMKKEQSLLSLLVPAPFRGSLWTAVIFLVGWRILAGRVW